MKFLVTHKSTDFLIIIMKPLEYYDEKIEGLREEYFAQLEMLINFLNYFPEKQVDWLIKLKLGEKEIKNIMDISDEFAKNKVTIINSRKPKTREQIIMIENETLKSLFEARLLFVKSRRFARKKIARYVLRLMYPEATILNTKKLRKLAKMLREKKMKMTDFLVFDPKSKKIYGIQVEKKK